MSQINYRKPQLIAKAYRVRGKIRWAKHSWFQPYEAFPRNTFAVPWPEVFIIWVKLNIHGKVSLKNCENHESLAQRIFPHLWYYYSQESSSKFKMFKILNTGKGSTQYISILLHKAIRFTSFQLYHRLYQFLYIHYYTEHDKLSLRIVLIPRLILTFSHLLL